jgi:dephospho-CoA kinase
MKTFGLTGNTGTGKTTVADMLRERGIPVLDADLIAREVVQPGEPALAAIVAAFGDEFVDADGSLRRQALGRRVFADPEALAKLNAITHPQIAQRTQQEMMRLAGEGAEVVVYDSAILVESGMAGAFNGLIVVVCAREEQIERIMSRDKLPREDAEQRVDAQMPLEKKVELADRVIDNSGTVSALEPQVAELLTWMGGR